MHPPAMIESTFLFLKGIGEATERRLWRHGVVSWRAFLEQPSLPGIAPARKRWYDEEVETAARHLERGHSRYFGACLKTRDHWRLFPTFRPRTLFLDIETTGGPPEAGEVTVVGLYSDGRMTTLVRHDSLTEARLNEELTRHDLLVTFFGSVFDIPYLRAKFPGLRADLPHMDLCFAARRLDLRGGLKPIEAEMGITRDADLDGVDGWEAVRLWQAWRRGNGRALDLLLRYNEADTRNLEPLAEILYRKLAERYGPPAPAEESAAVPTAVVDT
jgi:uncharacterized protein YprB with RNaseH-like and TPR domain